MTSDADRGIENHIEALVAEEHELPRAGERHEGLTDEEHQRLSAVKVELDRYWDLLRQRRAHEEFGLDANDTSMRDAETVERYEA
jgi:hypothetical protein